MTDDPQPGLDPDDESARPVWRRDALACGMIAAVTLAVFWPAFGYGFISFDDGTYVYQNAQVIRGLDPSSIAWAFAPQSGHWHPVTWLSLMLDSELFGLEPRAFHASALLIHILTACVIHLALSRATGRRGLGLLVAIGFAVHPLQVEPVIWISSRKDVLAGLFFALTLLAYVRWVRGERFAPFGLVAASLALGLMSKSMLVTVPFVLLLLDLWPLERLDPQALRTSLVARVREKALLFVLAGIAIALALVAASAHGMVYGAPILLRPLKVIDAYRFYLEKTLLPFDLSVAYPPRLPTDEPGTLLLAALVLVGLTVGAMRAWRTRPWLTVGWLWFVGMLVPVAGIVPVAGHDVALRYAYLPVVGLLIALVWGVDELVRSRPRARWPARAAAVAVIAALMWISSGAVEAWSSSERLFAHAIAVVPDNWIAHRALAGHYTAEDDLPRAIEQYEAVLEINPADWHSAANLGQLHARAGRHDRAIAYYRQALETGGAHPGHATPEQRAKAGFAALHFELAVSLSQIGRSYEAERELAEAVGLDPRYRTRSLPKRGR